MPSDTQLSGHVPFGCWLNPLLSPRAFTHLSVSRESPFAPMWTQLAGFIIQLSLLFHLRQINRIGWNFFVPIRCQLTKGKSVGLVLKYFYMIHRVGWFSWMANTVWLVFFLFWVANTQLNDWTHDFHQYRSEVCWQIWRQARWGHYGNDGES